MYYTQREAFWRLLAMSFLCFFVFFVTHGDARTYRKRAS